jgi:fibro-slime domain-containing protein
MMRRVCTVSLCALAGLCGSIAQAADGQRTSAQPSILPTLDDAQQTLITRGDGDGRIGATDVSDDIDAPLPPDGPQMLYLTGTARDFAELSVAGGHPDFELYPTGGFGQYVNIVADELDAENKPVFRSTGQGMSWSFEEQFRDGQGRPIMPPRSYIQQRSDDQMGVIQPSMTGAVTSAASLRQWFRDQPGTNLSMPLTITLQKNASGMYVFDDREDPRYQSVGGFFPLNGQLLGNSAGENRNFHFTYELNTVFRYHRRGDIFRFVGDDDVWVFIDGKLVIDIGGIHGAVQQTIDLDRLTWLQEGRTYDLRFFFAERHRTQSNFRIETTLALRTIEPPQVSVGFD